MDKASFDVILIIYMFLIGIAYEDIYLVDLSSLGAVAQLVDTSLDKVERTGREIFEVSDSSPYRRAEESDYYITSAFIPAFTNYTL